MNYNDWKGQGGGGRRRFGICTHDDEVVHNKEKRQYGDKGIGISRYCGTP